MRCAACNRPLTDFEATRKSHYSGEYIDLCNKCFRHVLDDVEVDERDDLRYTDKYPLEETFDNDRELWREDDE